MKLSRLLLSALALFPAVHAQEPRLSNLSTRAQAGAGDAVLTAGFVIGPGADKRVIIRAIGPTLGTAFGMTGVLANPILTLYGPNSSTRVAASNDNWSAVDAATFASVGAFALPAGSLDAAIVTTLAPGSYTAQVSGANNGTGIALVEVYEVGATGGKLINISTRAQVGTDASVMIPGVVISPGSGLRRLLVRAAGPALGQFGIGGTLADPTITLTNSTGATVATNDNWNSPSSSTAASGAQLTAAFATAGAFAFPANSNDSALLAEVGPGNYTLRVSGVGNTSGLALVEVYDLTPSGPPSVSIAASSASANEAGTLAGEFTVTRSGDTLNPLTVSFGISGSATNGIDYPALSGTVTIPAGASRATIALKPYPDTKTESTETVTLTLAPNSAYTIGAQAEASVSITDSPGTLYVATLRPAVGATGSAASGLATIVLSATGTFATVHVSFSNLSSGQVGGHLLIGDSNASGDYIFNLPQGQVDSALWEIQPSGTYSTSQILDALRQGRVYVGLDTSKYPSGEDRKSVV